MSRAGVKSVKVNVGVARVTAIDGQTVPREIPVFRPSLGDEEIAAVAATMRSGWVGPGPRTAEFEQQFAEYVDAPYAISTTTGTAAIQAALAALGVGPGDEVILPSFTWASAFQVIKLLGATPVFADIEPAYLNIDPDHVRALITPKTVGVVAVHHGGRPADLTALRQITSTHNLWLVDDAAHACGASFEGTPVGALTDATCFSFNAMKNLAIGDGGMVTTRSARLAERIASYRSLGIDRNTFVRYGTDEDSRGPRWMYDVTGPGARLHMNDISAAIGLVQLRRLPVLNARRAELTRQYEQGLAGISGLHSIPTPPGSLSSCHMFTVLIPSRDEMINFMRTRGVAIGVHYIPVHLFAVAAEYKRDLPVTEAIARNVATLPLYPTMTDSEQDQVISAMREFGERRVLHAHS